MPPLDVPFIGKKDMKAALKPGFRAGFQNLAQLFQASGGLSPTVSAAILPRLAMESESIATNFRGIQANQAGAAARGNLPVSIKAALDSALNVAQERAQRGARQEAMASSEDLRRDDLGQMLNLIQLLTTGKQNDPGLEAQGRAASAQKDAATMAAIGSIIAAFASASRFKEGIAPVSEEQMLSAVKSLPVYHWRYKWDPTPHVGPMAEDFMAAFQVGDSPDRIHMVDAVGALIASTKALARKVEALESGA